MWILIKEILTLPERDQWLTVAPKGISEYRKKWLNRILGLSFIIILLTLAYPCIIALPFLVVFSILILYMSEGRFWLLRCYDYLSAEELRRIEDHETDQLKNLLHPISKAQGFLMQGQLAAAKQKVSENENRQTMSRWK